MSAAPLLVALEVDIASADSFERSRGALAQLLAIGSMLDFEKILTSRPEISSIRISRSPHDDLRAMAVARIRLPDGSSMPAAAAGEALLRQTHIDMHGMEPRDPAAQRQIVGQLAGLERERLDALDFDVERDVDNILHAMEAANPALIREIQLPATLRQGFCGSRIAQELGLADLAARMERLALAARVADTASARKTPSL